MDLSIGFYLCICQKCNAFDRNMFNKLTDLAGHKYAVLCSLAYRYEYLCMNNIHI